LLDICCAAVEFESVEQPVLAKDHYAGLPVAISQQDYLARNELFNRIV